MSSIAFSLVTPEGVKFESEIWEVILPTPNGQIAVLPHHIPLITLANAGVVSIRPHQDTPDSNIQHLATSGGLISIHNKTIQLLADTAERAEDIDELRAKQALEQAREIQSTAKDHVSLADATRLIERNLVRLKVAELHRHHYSR
jgi:F-type H+-transporting ATPase subunit epsilon